MTRVGTDYTVRLSREMFSNAGNVHFSWVGNQVVGWIDTHAIMSPNETIFVETTGSGYDIVVNIDVNWECVQIDDSLADFVEAVYSETGVLFKMKPLPELGDGILVMKDGKLQVYPVPSSAVLGGDENGQLTSIPYSDCETACEEPSSSSM